MIRSSQTAVGALWLSLACAGPVSREPVLAVRNEVAPSELFYYGDTSSVTLPTSARVGERITLGFTTFGGGCVGPGAVDVAVAGRRAVVRPYRSYEPPRDSVVVCTTELRVDPRTAELRFLEPGRASVRLIGIAAPGGREYIIERHLRVEP